MKLPLANNNHSFFDKLKLSYFVLTKRWSMGEKVKELEEKLASRSEYQYCVATSSGSTANTLAAMSLARKNGKGKVLFCANGWSTTVSPFILAGFDPVFIDSGNHCPIMCPHQLEEYIKNNKVSAVVYTTLLGFSHEVEKVKEICGCYSVPLIIDSCEDSLGKEERGTEYEKIGSRGLFPAIAETESFYIAHEYQACPEMGAIYTNNKEDYYYYLSARNHGMTRGIESEYTSGTNSLVDKKFDFYVLGNNFRPTELSAYAVLLDLKKDQKFRNNVSKNFYETISPNGKGKFLNFSENSSLFCIPIVTKKYLNEYLSYYLISRVKEIVEEMGIESRPIVGGNLLRQTCFQEFGYYRDFPNAEHFHNFGIYIGLYRNMNKKLLFEFAKRIGNL